MKGFGKVSAGLCLAALLGSMAGCAAPGEESDGGRSASGEAEEGDDEISGMEAARLLGLHEPLPPDVALRKAMERAGGAIPLAMELTTLDAGPEARVVWEFEFHARDSILEVFVDARTGEVAATETGADPGEVEEAGRLLAGNPMGMNLVLAALARAVPNGLPLELELEDDDGVVTWEAEVAVGGRVSEWVLDPRTETFVADDEEDDGDEGDDGDGDDGDGHDDDEDGNDEDDGDDEDEDD